MIAPDSIEKTDDIPVLYVRKIGKYSETGNAAWEALTDFVESEKLDRTKLRYFGIAHDDPETVDSSQLRYDACIAAPSGIEGKGEVKSQVLKGGKYAIFVLRGSFDKLGETYENIFQKWLPGSKEKLDTSRGILQEYLNLEYVSSDPSKLITKILIPIF